MGLHPCGSRGEVAAHVAGLWVFRLIGKMHDRVGRGIIRAVHGGPEKDRNPIDAALGPPLDRVAQPVFLACAKINGRGGCQVEGARGGNG